MTSPAPDAGRTADENELREAIRKAIKGRWDLLTGPAQDAGNAIVGSWRRKDLCTEFADALLSGPLAPILQEAATARKERDEALEEVDLIRDDSSDQTRMLDAIAGKLGLAHDEGLDDAGPFLAAIDQLRSRLLQAEQGGEASGRDPSGPGCRPSDDAASRHPGKAASIPRAPKRDPEAVMAAYKSAYEAANGRVFTYEIKYEFGWVLFSYQDFKCSFDRKRLGELEKMTERLATRAALGIEAHQGRDEGSVEDESPARRAMPDPLNPNQEAGDHEPR